MCLPIWLTSRFSSTTSRHHIEKRLNVVNPGIDPIMYMSHGTVLNIPINDIVL